MTRTLDDWRAGRLTDAQLERLLRMGIEAFQRSAGLVVDGYAGPETVAALESASPPARLPRGKGIFIRDMLRHCGAARDLVDRCRKAGISWVSPLAIWQYESGGSLEPQIPGGHVNALREAGIAMWPWGYPVPGKANEFAIAMRKARHRCGGGGIIIDPENEWLGVGAGPVEELFDELDDDDRPVLVSSYGGKFPTFPWDAFAERAAAGIPQAYDAKDGLDLGYPLRAIERYRGHGFKVVFPAFAAWGPRGTGRQRQEWASVGPQETVVWWDWYNATRTPGMWDAIAEYTVTGGQA